MSRKVILAIVVALLMLAISAGVAWAQNEITCSADNQPCRGTDQEDQMLGGPQDDTIYGMEARDTIAGRFGNDSLYGGRGNDTIAGSFGDDLLAGNRGSDELWDTNGNDVDHAQGGPGNDRINVDDGDRLDTVSCGQGRNDTVTADPGDTVARSCEHVHRN